MRPQVEYLRDSKTIPFGDGVITIENLSPAFSITEQEKTHREIETKLFGVLLKYSVQTRNPHKT